MTKIRKRLNTAVSAALLSAAIFSLFSCGMNGGKPGGSTGTDTGTTAAGDSGKITETNTETERITETESDTDMITDTEKVTETETEKETEITTVPETTVPEDNTVRVSAVTWVAEDIPLTADKEYDDPVYHVTLDAVFKNRKSGKTIRMPGFWNGGRRWVIRIALNEPGEWDFYTVCSKDNDTGLHGVQGVVTVKKYTGKLDIYRHGFLRTEPGRRYFMYSDGTPFFYIGDTHWTMPLESLYSNGNVSDEDAEKYGIKTQFHYIVDYRVKQGFTVYQSQQLGYYQGVAGNSWIGDAGGSIFDYGVTDKILEQFKTLDIYFAYIAKKGMVHAHSQFSYPEELIETYLGGKISDEKLELLCRYWVARYGAYPVMWTTAQEADNDYYEWSGCTVKNNPWKKVMKYIAAFDPYSQPMTAHQENVGNTRVFNSAFADMKEHNWFGAQFTTQLNTGVDWNIVREYYDYGGEKPVVNFEGRYDHFWTGEFGARSQGWIAYLNGMFGYGYGIQPLFNIFWAYNGDTTPAQDESGQVYRRDLTWLEGLHSAGGEQMRIMKDFFTSFDWYNLVPCFSANEYYIPDDSFSTAATVGNEMYVVYCFGKSGSTGSIMHADTSSDYTVYWFNPRTGETADEGVVEPKSGKIFIPEKPDRFDWVYVARKNS